MQPTYAVQIPKRFWNSHRHSGLERHIPALDLVDPYAVDAKIQRETKTLISVRLTVEEMQYLLWDARRATDCVGDAKWALKDARYYHDEDSLEVVEAKEYLAETLAGSRAARAIEARLDEVAR